MTLVVNLEYYKSFRTSEKCVVRQGMGGRRGWTGRQAAISISGPGRSCKVGPDGVFPVFPLLSMSGLSGISPMARPAHDVSSISGCTVLDSGLVAPPRFSGTKDFERPAREWDLNTILKGRNGAAFSNWSSISSGRSKVGAEPGGEARKTGRGSGLLDSISTISLRDMKMRQMLITEQITDET